MSPHALIRTAIAVIALACAAGAAAADLSAAIAGLQHGWAEAYYQLPEDARHEAFERLQTQAERTAAEHPGRAEPLIWQAIVLSSAAKFEGGLGALSKVKQARKLLQRAEALDAEALDGSVYTSLGSLYAKVPGWPLGFGDKDKAADYLKKALAINPDGIDPNFFYGELLAARGDTAQARAYLEKALQAPPRPGREDADAGRRAEIRAALAALN